MKSVDSVTSATVDLSAVSERNYQDHKDLVVDLVDDPEVTSTNSPFSGTTNQLLRTGRPRVGGQELNCSLHAPSRRRIKLAQLPDRGRRNLYPVGHTSPRSALT